jgi:hypothetical protein
MTRRVRKECAHAPPRPYHGRVFLDWHDHPVAARPGPCRCCARSTALLDCTGSRCHKACAEAEATRDLSTTAPAPAARRPRRPVDRRGLVLIEGGAA